MIERWGANNFVHLSNLVLDRWKDIRLVPRCNKGRVKFASVRLDTLIQVRALEPDAVCERCWHHAIESYELDCNKYEAEMSMLLLAAVDPE